MDNKRFIYHATGGAFLLVFLKNAFLTVITFGIYGFWARTNVQKFVAENLEWAGERFTFHGTGKERFIGFLKAAVILVGAVIVIQIIGKILGSINLALASIVTAILTLGLFLTIVPFVIVGSRKYLTSRTGYRNLRFGFDGKGLEIAKIYLKGGLLTIVTLGIYYPWFYSEKEAYLASKTRYGNTNFEFQADGKEIFFIYLKGVFLSIITLGIYSSWFAADLQNYIWNHRSFQGKKFQSDITGGKIFLNAIIAYLIVLFTFGIGLSWAIVRISKLFFESVSLETEVDFASISAKADPTATAIPEGLEVVAEALEGFLAI
ncbi:membrane protein [Leptospira kobayashii]|uniref:Membrane protein n=1 Tax=Leptospira kobayashii TaxID=1917830 RepID=A0ABN6KKK8_9LEPT|nr:DUF898 family protein [Leptospira kobayashii]BDA80474.1 membrane protein [Leptospira kobayashii]